MSQIRYAPPIYNPPQQRQVSIVVSALDPAAATYDLNAEPGSYAISGSDATLARGLFINAEPGSFAISGADATLEAAAAPPNVALRATKAHTPRITEQVSQVVQALEPAAAAAYELNAEPGSYTISGFEATLEFASGPAAPPNVALRAVKAHTPRLTEQVSQVLQAFDAPTAHELNAEPGSFTISGIETTLLHDVPQTWDRVVSPNYAHSTVQDVYGSRTFSGVEVASGDYELDAQPGSFTISGSSATLARGLFINAEPGSYTISGSDATLARGLFVNAVPGSYTISGADADLVHATPGAYSLDAQPGSYTITGTAASAIADRVLSADSASFAISGSNATLARGLFVSADPGSYSITGAASTTTYFPSIFFTSTVTAQTSIVVSGGTANRAYELPMRGVG